ncbi:MAG: iron ABC transporter permease [Phycisphaerales bacterium]|nr:iron ABC transporter permease [Phycisphaerales bacterium]
MNRRRTAVWIALLVLLSASCLVRLMLTRTTAGELFLAWPTSEYLSYRLIPMFSALIVGGVLGSSGMGLQVLLRNPLASPWILGLSSGAGLGVMASMMLAHYKGAPVLEGETIGAIAGAFAALFVVFILARGRGGLDPLTMVLVGVVVSVICGAGIMTLQHLVPAGLRGSFITWLMGSLPETLSMTRLVLYGGVGCIGILLLAWWGPSLDAACLSDDEATSVGVHLPSLRFKLFFVSSVLAAIGVVIAGPIAFVGLIAPHGARLLFRSNHRTIALGSAGVGALLLVSADDLRQLIDLGTGRLPVGIVTSILGGLVFLVLLIRNRGNV